MKNKFLVPYEIRTIGFVALLRELGSVGAIRFIQQYESGYGNYTRDRKKKKALVHRRGLFYRSKSE